MLKDLQNNNFFRAIIIYADLAKYKLSLAITFSSATGYFLYSNTIDRNFFFLIAGILLLAAGSAALNQFTEREKDSLMPRTMSRPIPAKKVSIGSVIVFFSFLLISGSCLLLLNGIIPFALGALCIVLYNFFYTSLKRISLLAILPGALVGAIPPLTGWVSAGGPILSYEILLFSAFIFLWQLPHFWLLLIKFGKEYEAAGFKTLTRYLDEKQIKYLIFFWAFLSLVFLLFFAEIVIDIKSELPNILIILNLIFILLFYRLLFLQKSSQDTKSAFILFNSYGLLIMVVLIADSLYKL